MPILAIPIADTRDRRLRVPEPPVESVWFREANLTRYTTGGLVIQPFIITEHVNHFFVAFRLLKLDVSAVYRVPLDLDLSAIIGEFTTQIRVGQSDIQFAFGAFNFAIQSPVSLVRNGEVIGRWVEGRWPDSAFFDSCAATEALARRRRPVDEPAVVH